MKRLFILLALCAAVASCGSPVEKKVMARYVPERYDDFVYENNFVAGRFYGIALEADVPGGHLVSPGIDVWVKYPGALVADTLYKRELQEGISYHKNSGLGKDCYKVSKSLGAGASVALAADGSFLFPEHNYSSSEVLEDTPYKVVFVLHYPEWQAGDITIKLDKKVSVTADTYFCAVEDCYTFSGVDSLEIAAGIFRHPAQETIEAEFTGEDRYAIWEHASDQSVEPEDGMIGVAVVVPGAASVRCTEDGVHGICTRFVKSGEPFNYCFGSCWSKGNVTSPEDWFNIVRSI
ncbi:MAG: DUF4861 family protein [Bacteroidales bacterium]|nr:DUF4861 family protein [Bacteroidales bacterium]